MSKKKQPENQPPLLADEWFDLDGHGDLAVEPDEDDEDTQPRLSWADIETVCCPVCESENISFNGQVRVAHMRPANPFFCRDCGHSFFEGSEEIED